MRPTFLACLLVLAGCELGSSDTPDEIGTFTIDATLVSNTCGYGGFPADNFFQKTAVLGGYAGESASFTWKDGSAVDGSATTAGTYQFSGTSSHPSSQVDPATGQPYCTFNQTTQITFTVTPTPRAPVDGGVDDAGADAGNADGGTANTYALEGTYTEDIVGVGTSCAAFLGMYGGSFDALPCRVTYTIKGTAPR